jgi:hypothetical protein
MASGAPKRLRYIFYLSLMSSIHLKISLVVYVLRTASPCGFPCCATCAWSRAGPQPHSVSSLHAKRPPAQARLRTPSRSLPQERHTPHAPSPHAPHPHCTPPTSRPLCLCHHGFCGVFLLVCHLVGWRGHVLGQKCRWSAGGRGHDELEEPRAGARCEGMYTYIHTYIHTCIGKRQKESRTHTHVHAHTHTYTPIYTHTICYERER